MAYELSVQEKTDIINQHLRNVELSRYNLQLSIMEEEAKSEQDEQILEALNSNLSDLNAKKSALLAELSSL